jgi:hypothetical protein
MKTLQHIILIVACCLLFACNRDDDGFKPLTDSEYLALIQDKLNVMNMPRPAGSCTYPVYPGTEVWASLGIHERYELIEVPYDRLKNMSTQAVLQAIWEYPLLFEVVFSCSGCGYQAEFDYLSRENNAYKELLQREDVGECLLERLLCINPIVLPRSFHSWILPQALEVLISQSVFLSQLSSENKKQIIETTLKNDSLRQEHDINITSTHFPASWLLMARILVSANYSPFMDEVEQNEGLRVFIENRRRNSIIFLEYGNDISQLIIDHAQNFIK